MSTIQAPKSVKRSDPKRSAQAKAATIARRQARAAKYAR
jgi:hypothetical protein